MVRMAGQSWVTINHLLEGLIGVVLLAWLIVGPIEIFID